MQNKWTTGQPCYCSSLLSGAAVLVKHSCWRCEEKNPKADQTHSATQTQTHTQISAWRPAGRRDAGLCKRAPPEVWPQRSTQVNGFNLWQTQQHPQPNKHTRLNMEVYFSFIKVFQTLTVTQGSVNKADLICSPHIYNRKGSHIVCILQHHILDIFWTALQLSSQHVQLCDSLQNSFALVCTNGSHEVQKPFSLFFYTGEESLF